MLKRLASATALFCALSINTTASASLMAITEWMYSGLGSGGEFVEFTNVGLSSIDMANWSFNDSDLTDDNQSLSAFGLVQPGESVILTELDEAAFRANWSLAQSVKIIGGSLNNLGRSDQINLFDGVSATPVDTLTYNDQGTGTVKGPRTNGISANPSAFSVVGTNNASQWVASAANDRFGSFTSGATEIGNPGVYVDAPVPEPSMLALLASAGLAFAAFIRRRKQ
jgi:predicted extracellular nuclease